MGFLFYATSTVISSKVKNNYCRNFIKFYFRFDPMFNASVNLLISQASNPISEDQQQLYNEFVQSYGTYYVSNVIVGGTAHLYSFVGDSYYKLSTYEQMTQQISFTASYMGFTFNADTQTEEIYQQITESFKKNSNILSVFQPPVASVKNQSVLQ